MPIYTLRNKKIEEIQRTHFQMEGIQERDLQLALIDQINAISPDTLIIAEEFSEWTEGQRRIALLGIDKQANLVVIELKRNKKGDHMELQALRYAAMVSTMTFEQAVEVYEQYLTKHPIEKDPEEDILDFLGWSESLEEEFPTDVKIVLASGGFSRKLTTSVMWLNERNLDIRCVRLQPYKLGEELLLNIEQIIPLPEAEEYQIKVQEKAEAQRVAAKKMKDMPLIEKIRDKCKAEGFTKSPQLPMRREVQKWIDEYGREENLLNRVEGHICYWIIRGKKPDLNHEQVLGKLSLYGTISQENDSFTREQVIERLLNS